MKAKRFAFLELFENSNRVIAEGEYENKMVAVAAFQQKFPHLILNDDGYYKIGNLSYCVAEYALDR